MKRLLLLAAALALFACGDRPYDPVSYAVWDYSPAKVEAGNGHGESVTTTASLHPFQSHVSAPTVNVGLAWAPASAVTAATIRGDVVGAAWWAPSETTAVTLSSDDGLKQLSLFIADRKGKVHGPYGAQVTLDSVSPEITLLSTPAPLSPDSSAEFTFEADKQVTFECRLNFGVWNFCTSPVVYADLSDGLHIFEVRAMDAAQNRSAYSMAFQWEVAIP